MKKNIHATVNGEELVLPAFTPGSAGGDRESELEIRPQGRHRFDVRSGNTHLKAFVGETAGGEREIWIGRYRCVVRIRDEQQERLSAFIRSAQVSSGGTIVRAPMPGLVKDVAVARGDVVVKGQRLLILEAMKMENEISSPIDGTITKCTLTSGNSVEKDQELIQISLKDE